MRKTIVAITLGLSLFCKMANAQSPWTKEKKHAFIQLGGSGIFYDLVRYNNSVIGAFNLDNIPSAGANNFGIYFKL